MRVRFPIGSYLIITFLCLGAAGSVGLTMARFPNDATNNPLTSSSISPAYHARQQGKPRSETGTYRYQPAVDFSDQNNNDQRNPEEITETNARAVFTESPTEKARSVTVSTGTVSTGTVSTGTVHAKAPDQSGLSNRQTRAHNITPNRAQRNDPLSDSLRVPLSDSLEAGLKGSNDSTITSKSILR